MGNKTGKTFQTIYGTGKGSDHFGLCDQCGKKMSEAFKTILKTEWKRENGEIYYCGEDYGAFGHDACLARFGPFFIYEDVAPKKTYPPSHIPKEIKVWPPKTHQNE